jgi:hypothetical protein
LGARVMTVLIALILMLAVCGAVLVADAFVNGS